MKNRPGLTAYLRRVERALDCPSARRRALLEKVRRDAGELFGGRLDVSEEEAAACLGDPEELARGLLETLDREELERYRRKKALLFRAAVVLLLAALIGTGRWAYYVWTHPKKIEIIEDPNPLIIYSEKERP